MRLGIAFARLVFPDGFVNDDQRAVHEETVMAIGNFTLREFFAALRTEAILKNLPNLATEREEDLQDVTPFFNQRFAKMS